MAEICFNDGGRVDIQPIPADRPEPPEAPPIACIGCRTQLHGGDGFFVEIDAGDWGVGCQMICGSCMAEALRPRNVLGAYWTRDRAHE